MERRPAVEEIAKHDLWRNTRRADPKPHHLGHRERLRDRARAGGLAGLPDYELLELYLFRAIPQKDTKPIAKALIARFGSLTGVWAASPEELCSVPGVGEAVALDLRLIHEAVLRASRDEVRKRAVISSSAALNAYVRAALAHEPREQFRVLFLDRKNQLIADEIMNRGTVDHAPVYPREVVRRALELAASAVILVHNHPTYSVAITANHAGSAMGTLVSLNNSCP